jgi:hypothetical protein
VQFLDVIVGADDIPDDQKARICKKLGETDKVCPAKITVLQFVLFLFPMTCTLLKGNQEFFFLPHD